MMRTGKIAIVILNWNGKFWLEKFLPNVLEHSRQAQVYVIDNASTDDSISFVKENFSQVKIIKNKNNSGFAGGYNEGLKDVKEEIYCLLNSDVEVSSDWLSPIISLFEKNENIAAMQPKILSYYNKNKFEFAGAGGGLIDNLGYPYCRGRVFDTLEDDNGQYDDETEIFWASGCCLFIRNKDFWAMNGFDESFFAHQEEIDLCWRLINSGKKIYYTGLSKVYHIGGGTLNKQNPKKTFLNIRNNLSMLLKNMPLVNLFWVLPVRLFLDGMTALYLGYKEGISHIWAVIKAYFNFYLWIPQLLRNRGRNQKKHFYQTKFLVFKYFSKKTS